MSKSKLNYEEKLLATKEYKKGKWSHRAITQKYGIAEITLRDIK